MNPQISSWKKFIFKIWLNTACFTYKQYFHKFHLSKLVEGKLNVTNETLAEQRALSL